MKKILFLLFSFSLILTLVSCGSGEKLKSYKNEVSTEEFIKQFNEVYPGDFVNDFGNNSDVKTEIYSSTIGPTSSSKYSIIIQYDQDKDMVSYDYDREDKNEKETIKENNSFFVYTKDDGVSYIYKKGETSSMKSGTRVSHYKTEGSRTISKNSIQFIGFSLILKPKTYIDGNVYTVVTESNDNVYINQMIFKDKSVTYISYKKEKDLFSDDFIEVNYSIKIYETSLSIPNPKY